MADFSEYTGPSAEWLALEATLPAMPTDLSVAQMKEMLNKSREESAAQDMIDQGLSSVVQMHDHTITARDGAVLEARTYRPAGVPISEHLPVFFYGHGGGFVFGTLASEDATCSRIVSSRAKNNTPVVVFNLNYRHTPEHKYPVAWNDFEDAFVWLHEHIAEIGGISDQVVVGGTSAGGCLSASLTLMQLRGENERLAACPKIAGQILMIPVLVQWDHYAPRQELLKSPELSSYVQCAQAPVLPLERMRLFDSLLDVPKAEKGTGDLRINPGNVTAEDVKNLPPTTLGIAGNDPLRDEGLFYGKHLAENGVPTNVHVFPGVPHSFRRWGEKLPGSKRWDQLMSEGTSWALSKPAAGPFEIHSEDI
ncbi:unnamed protein product [Penicillium olsonii]|nr:unnamed protein product [Penicillium olsonii]